MLIITAQPPLQVVVQPSPHLHAITRVVLKQEQTHWTSDLPLAQTTAGSVLSFDGQEYTFRCPILVQMWHGARHKNLSFLQYLLIWFSTGMGAHGLVMILKCFTQGRNVSRVNVFRSHTVNNKLVVLTEVVEGDVVIREGVWW